MDAITSTWFIWTVRVDFLVYNEDATALLDCVTLSNCGSSCGVVPLPAWPLLLVHRHG